MDPLRILFLTCTFLLCIFSSNAQSQDTTKYLEIEIFITIWNGDTIVSEIDVQQELDQLNTSFNANNTGIQFVLCGQVKFINDPSGQLAFGNTSAPYGNYEKRGAIHIWHCHGLPGGIPALSTGEARILFTGGYGSTSIEHEMGHTLALRHTHQGGELVDGSNCTAAGDQVCDTPADPGLNGTNVIGCVYVGSAVDANGQPYTPLTNNFMSYAPNSCRTAFTTGQVNRMNNYLNTSGFWINHIDSVRDVAPISTTFCSTDPVGYTLNPYLAGATFSGPGVIGNQFYPSTAGTGIHELQISYPSDSLVYNDFVASSQGSINSTTSAWNSYPVANGGKLQNVRVRISTAVTTTVTLEVRNGSGIAGILLHSQAVTINPTTGFEWIVIPITNPIQLNTGQLVTFRIVSASAVTYGCDLFIYPGVNSSLPAMPAPYKNLFSMVVQIKGPESCGSIGYRYVEVVETNNGSIVDLRSDYCNTLSRDLLLTGNPSDGLFFIDGVPATELNPQNLSLGNHILEFSSTDINGCSGLISQTFAIYDYSASISPVPAANYFVGDPIVNLAGSPAGGTMLIDGINTTSLDPTALGVGPHQVSYFNYEVQDSVLFSGPLNPNPGYMNHVVHYLDSVAWQEFTPADSGYLHNIGISGIIAASYTAEVKLFKGTVDQGILLLTDTVWTNVMLDGYNLLFDTLNGIYLEKDSLYSFSHKRLDNIPLNMWLPYTLNDNYTGGMSSVDDPGVPAFDFAFKVFMYQLAACTDTVTNDFNVSINDAGLESQSLENRVLVFPNPTSDKVTIFVDDGLLNQPYFLMDVNQRVIKEGILIDKQTNLNLTNLPVGFYMIKIGSQVFEIIKI